jgi:hypothetical protein
MIVLCFTYVMLFVPETSPRRCEQQRQMAVLKEQQEQQQEERIRWGPSSMWCAESCET